MKECEVTHPDIVGDLVIAMLSVNNWPLDKSFALREELKRLGMFDLDCLSKMSRDEIFRRLVAAGYKRSDYVVHLLVDRFQNMASVLSGGGIDRLRSLIDKKQSKELDQFLLAIKGVGPTVLNNFKLLTGAGM
jgi:hypothetical protein